MCSNSNGLWSKPLRIWNRPTLDLLLHYNVKLLEMALPEDCEILIALIIEVSSLKETELLLGEVVTHLLLIERLIEDLLCLLYKLFTNNLHEHCAQLNKCLQIHISHVLIPPQGNLRVLYILKSSRSHDSKARGLFHHGQHSEQNIG